MPDQHRGRLDRAIDRAVRDMVQVDPQPGLRHRVADRIQTGHPGTGRSWRTYSVWPALATAAALVIVVTAFALLRAPVVTPPEAQVADMVPATAAAAPPTPTTAPPEPTVTPPPAPRRSATAPGRASAPANRTPSAPGGLFGGRTGRVSAANLAPTIPPEVESVVEPLPGGLAPLAPISIERIKVAPLAVRPVTINALPGGR